MKYCWYTVLYWFQACYGVIKKWYTLLKAHYAKYSYHHHTKTYDITDYIPHAVLYIHMNYLFYNWKFMSFYSLHLVCPSPSPTTSGSSLCLWVHCYFVCLFLFLWFSMYVESYGISFSVWLISRSIILSRSIHVVPSGRISSFFMANIPFCICNLSFLSFYILVDT